MGTDEVAEVVRELEATAQFLENALRSVPADRWDTRIADIDFSLRQELCHLRDVELEGYLVRIVRMIAEECPVLTDLDGARLAQERNYAGQDPLRALRDFASLRALSVAKLRALAPQDWGRKGRFDGGSALDLRELVSMMATHDRQHRGEVSALTASALRRP